MEEILNSATALTKGLHLDQKQKELIERRNRFMEAFSMATEARKGRRMRRLCKQLQQINEFLDSLEKIKAETRPLPDSTVHRYVVSSLFLLKCFEDLTPDQDEHFFFITGVEVEGTLILDQKVEFRHEKRSMTGVTADPKSTHRVLIWIAQFGHRLLAHFHSHPGNGADMTHPSGKDESFQKRLELGGYPTVAAIFSRDGYIRFFRLDRNMEIQIYGDGVEDLGNFTYRLTNLHSA